jgi:hypothetical protein
MHFMLTFWRKQSSLEATALLPSYLAFPRPSDVRVPGPKKVKVLGPFFGFSETACCSATYFNYKIARPSLPYLLKCFGCRNVLTITIGVLADAIMQPLRGHLRSKLLHRTPRPE